MKTKSCTSCTIIKNISEYHKDTSNKDGLYSYCRECELIRVLKYRRTKDGLISRIYSSQKTNSKRRKHQPPTYTKEELKEWMFSQKKFHVLYDNWKRLDYQSMYKPSVDRKDDYIGYTMDNIQLATWGENNAKGHYDIKHGINNKISKSIIQFNMDGYFIAEYHSMREASRITLVNISSLCHCCSGKKNHAGGFKWKYSKQQGEKK